ncbi:response regulator transcription factor [Diaphorobacter aerolatus]|uniref:Response regulator transcription factor n=1 Tax=Diaphorobacter aerolatus TaxID=1288495 RepID=A0A7H0GL29_9BURK|nr:response regulator transcription factor [Diaphorobacter aerolatus]QNP48995.1 response regulator transcription factor [Diaphorobacter aerolatus]
MKKNENQYGYGMVVDDHPLVAHGITEFLTRHPMLSHAMNVQSTAAVWQTIADQSEPAIILVDYWIGDESTSEFIQELRRRCPQIRVLGISGDARRQEITEALQRCGAHGFYGKNESAQRLFQAVQVLLSGAEWFTPEKAPTPRAVPRDIPVSARNLGLTERQGQTLSLVLEGKSNKQIAQELGLSEHTIKEYVSAIFIRLGVSNRTQLIQAMHGRSVQ